MTQSFDAPDPELTALAATINKKVRAGRVSFFAKTGDVSMIMQNGPRRAVIALGGRPSEGDIGDMVAAVEAWAGFQADDPRYTTELPPSPESGW